MNEDTKTFFMGCFVVCFIAATIGISVTLSNKFEREAAIEQAQAYRTADIERIRAACGVAPEVSESTRTAQCVLAITQRSGR